VRGLCFDRPERDKKWLLQHQRSLPTLSDTDYVASGFCKVHGIPALVLVGIDGKIRILGGRSLRSGSRSRHSASLPTLVILTKQNALIPKPLRAESVPN
jgi:hypothetical protein